MTRSIRRKATLAAVGVTGAAGALALALTGPSVAFAEDPSGSPTPSASASADSDRATKHAQRQAELAEALAKELGVDKEKVAAALAKIDSERAAARPDLAKPDRAADLKTRLDKAVSEGKLTRAEADAILKAADAGVLPFGGGHRGPAR